MNHVITQVKTITHCDVTWRKTTQTSCGTVLGTTRLWIRTSFRIEGHDIQAVNPEVPAAVRQGNIRSPEIKGTVPRQGQIVQGFAFGERQLHFLFCVEGAPGGQTVCGPWRWEDLSEEDSLRRLLNSAPSWVPVYAVSFFHLTLFGVSVPIFPNNCHIHNDDSWYIDCILWFWEYFSIHYLGFHGSLERCALPFLFHSEESIIG